AADRQALQTPVARSLLGRQDLADCVMPMRGGAVHHLRVRHYGARDAVTSPWNFGQITEKQRASSATRISLSPNCQSSHWLGRLPERCAMVSSIPIGQLRPKNVEGIMRSVQALAVAVWLLLPAFDVASAGGAITGGLRVVLSLDSPGRAS